jgi:hypothetical protein
MNKIRGEYWIENGNVNFADGDVGDYNHEALAWQSVAGSYLDEITTLADELKDIGSEFGYQLSYENHYDEINPEKIAELVRDLVWTLEEHKELSSGEAIELFCQKTKIPYMAYKVIVGSGDSRNYVMQVNGWIAVRGMNIELFGYNEQKRKSLLSGLNEILDKENIDIQNPIEYEFEIYDHKNNRNTTINLEDIQNPVAARATTIATNKGDRRFAYVPPDASENLPQKNISQKDAPEPNSQKLGWQQFQQKYTSENTIGFKEWIKNLEEKTLYHGTLADYEPSIKAHGLKGGWHGPLGSFVANYYDDDEYGEPNEDDEIVFMTDKKRLGKAVNAMVFHIEKKLNKEFHDVTDNDIRNHGLLVMIKDADAKQYDPMDYQQQNAPRGLEDQDYYSSKERGDVFLKGSALIRFLQRYGEFPRDFGPSNPQREKQMKGIVAAKAIAGGMDKKYVMDKINQAKQKDIEITYKNQMR